MKSQHYEALSFLESFLNRVLTSFLEFFHHNSCSWTYLLVFSCHCMLSDSDDLSKDASSNLQIIDRCNFALHFWGGIKQYHWYFTFGLIFVSNYIFNVLEHIKFIMFLLYFFCFSIFFISIPLLPLFYTFSCGARSSDIESLLLFIPVSCLVVGSVYLYLFLY